MIHYFSRAYAPLAEIPTLCREKIKRGDRPELLSALNPVDCPNCIRVHDVLREGALEPCPHDEFGCRLFNLGHLGLRRSWIKSRKAWDPTRLEVDLVPSRADA